MTGTYIVMISDRLLYYLKIKVVRLFVDGSNFVDYKCNFSNMFSQLALIIFSFSKQETQK